jgi:hypothetical protein
MLVHACGVGESARSLGRVARLQPHGGTSFEQLSDGSIESRAGAK